MSAVDLKLSFGLRLHRAGHLAEAVQIYRDALDIDPDHGETNYLLGLAALQAGQAEDAHGHLSRALAADPDHTACRVCLAAACAETGRAEEAAEHYRHALARDPDNPEAHTKFAILRAGAGAFDEAIAHYRQALGADPGRAEAHNGLGSVLRAQDRLVEARAAFEQALALKPDYAQAHNNLGNLLGHIGESDLALDAFLSAIEFDPDCAEAHYNMAHVLRAQHRSAAAYSAFSRAIEIKPDFVAAWSHLSQMLTSWEKADEAIECYRRMRDLVPSNPDANHMIAALRGETTEGPPEDYVKNLFDNYASTFETHLVETLAYNVPRLLREELDRFVPDRTRFDGVVDLGCGTGLCGDAFRDISGRILGIDLSAKMITKASRKNVYDSLEVGEISQSLREKNQTYDLFLSADVFIYVGGLDDIFGAVRARARPEALFAFSVEGSDGDGFELLRTGRYAHSRNYIEGLAAMHDFTIGQRREIIVRQDRGCSIDGSIYVLEAGKSKPDPVLSAAT